LRDFDKVDGEFGSEWNGWEGFGDGFPARSELALIPNMMHMDAGFREGCEIEGD